MRYRIDVDQVNYRNNSLADNTPYTTPPEQGGYEHYPKRVEGHVIRGRSESFNDFFSQVRIFWNSLTPVEKQQTIEGFSYQLGKVKSESVRQQNVNLLVNVDQQLAYIVADNIGVNRPSGTHVPVSTSYASLSQANTPRYAATLKVGVLISDGFDGNEVKSVLAALEQNGIFTVIVSETLKPVTGNDGTRIKVDQTFITGSPYLYDSLYVVGGTARNKAKFNGDVTYFRQAAYRYYKPIGVATTGQAYFEPSKSNNLSGVVFAANNPNFAKDFVNAIAQQRFWDRT